MGEQTLLSVIRFIITRFLCPRGGEGGIEQCDGRLQVDGQSCTGFEPGMGLVIDIFFFFKNIYSTN